jgi:hypothetical protein
MTTKRSQICVAGLLLISFTALSRCEATLAEGIDFDKSGCPGFLSKVSGMSGQKVLERWKDAVAVPVMG